MNKLCSTADIIYPQDPNHFTDLDQFFIDLANESCGVKIGGLFWEHNRVLRFSFPTDFNYMGEFFDKVNRLTKLKYEVVEIGDNNGA
jgi:hypothetical protein